MDPIVAAWFNVVVCGAIMISVVYVGFTQDPGALLVAAGGAILEVLFIRRLLAAYRGEID